MTGDRRGPQGTTGSNTSIARTGLAALVGVVSQGAMRFLINLAVGQAGGPGALGVTSTVLSAATLSSLMGPSALGSAASRHLAEARGAGDSESVASVRAYVGRLWVVLILVLSPVALTVWFLAVGGGASLFVLFVLVVGITAWQCARGSLFGLGRGVEASKLDLAVAVASIALGGAVAFATDGSVWSVTPLGLGFAIAAAAKMPWPAASPPSKAARSSIRKFVLMGTVGTLVSAGLLQVSILVARGAGSAADAGQYAAALTIATPGSMLAGALSLVLFPELARRSGEGNQSSIRHLTDKATRASVFLMGAVFGVLLLIHQPFMLLVWGDDFAAGTEFLPWLLVALFVNAASTPCVNSITAESLKGMRRSMYSSVTGAAVGVVTFAATWPLLGIIAVPVSYMVGVIAIAFWPVAYVIHRDRPAWWGLGWKLLAGSLGIGLYLGTAPHGGGGPVRHVLAVLVFVTLWGLLFRNETQEARLALTGVARRST